MCVPHIHLPGVASAKTLREAQPQAAATGPRPSDMLTRGLCWGVSLVDQHTLQTKVWW